MDDRFVIERLYSWTIAWAGLAALPVAGRSRAWHGHMGNTARKIRKTLPYDDSEKKGESWRRLEWWAENVLKVEEEASNAMVGIKEFKKQGGMV